MGNVQSNLYVDLDRGESNPTRPGHYALDIKKKQYGSSGNFEYSDFKITFDKQYSYSDASYYYVYIREIAGGDIIFTYYTYEAKDVLQNIEAYFSKQHPNTPLIIGFITSEGKRYYTYKFLKSEKSSYGFPKKGHFNHSELESKLKEELNNLNKKITFKTGNRIKGNVSEKTYDVLHSKIRKVEFTPTKEKESPYVLYSSELFRVHTKNNRIDDSVLKEVNDKPFDSITVYYLIPDYIAVLIEFVDGYNKTYFKRNDAHGFYWEKDTTSYNTEPNELYRQLTKVKTEGDKRITYQLDKNFSYNKVAVIEEKHPNYGYTMYTHLPTNSDHLTSVDVKYNNNVIQILENTNIKNRQDRLESFDRMIITKVDTYVLNTNQKEHLLMKVMTKERKTYFLYKFEKYGNKWKQLGTNYLTAINIKNEQFQQVEDTHGSEDSGKTLERYITNKPENVQRLLKDISAEINSMVILLEKKLDYGGDVMGEITKHNKDIPPVDLRTNTIDVKRVDQRNGKRTPCSTIDGYTVYNHVLSFAGDKALAITKPSSLYIRLYYHNKKIRLFDRDESGKAIYLEYKQGCDLYVYFENSSNIPLLVLYNDTAFKPKDKELREWFLVKEIKKCDKSMSSVITRKLEEIKKQITSPNPPNVVETRDGLGSGRGTLTTTHQSRETQGKTYNGDPSGKSFKPGSPGVSSEGGGSDRMSGIEEQDTLQVVKPPFVITILDDYETQVRDDYEQTHSDNQNTNANDGGPSAGAIGGGVGGGIAAGGGGVGVYLLYNKYCNLKG